MGGGTQLGFYVDAAKLPRSGVRQDGDGYYWYHGQETFLLRPVWASTEGGSPTHIVRFFVVCCVDTRVLTSTMAAYVELAKSLGVEELRLEVVQW